MSDPNHSTFHFWQSYYDFLATPPSGARTDSDGQFDLDAEAEMYIVKGKIADIEAEIMRLREAISAHEVQLNGLRQRAQLHKKLPEEILTKIFSFSSCPLNFLTLTTHPLWTIRQVSSRWRFVVMNNSRLWNHLKIELPTKSLKFDVHRLNLPWDRIVDKAVTLVPRSGPVTIDIDCLGQMYYASTMALQTLAIVGECLSSRTRELRFIAGYSAMNAFLSQSPYPLTWLESLVLDARQDQNFQSETDVVTPLVGAENLKSLTFSGLMFSIPQRSQVLHSLTRLTIDTREEWRIASDGTVIRTDNVLDFLVICPNLIECFVYFHPVVPRLDERRGLFSESRLPGSVQLLHLQNLRVTDAARYFLEALTLPSLKMLSLGYKDLEFGPLPAEAIVNLVRRSSCSITTFSHHIHWLSFNYTDDQALARLPTEQLETILTVLPTLEELTTSLAFDDPVILQQIAQGTLIPKIRSICCGTTQDPVDVLETLSLRFRQKDSQTASTRSLIRAIVFPHWFDESESVDWFQTYQERIAPLAQEYNRVCIDIPMNEGAFRERVFNGGSSWSSDEISC